MANNDAKRSGKPEIEGVHFKPAKGGLISETSMKFKRGGQGGGPMHDYEHETAVHPTMEHAQAHLAKMMSQHCKDSE